MKLNEIINSCALTVATTKPEIDCEVSGGYAGDLLSDVMANARDGYIWVTIQTHINIVAVAVLKNLSGIILVNGRAPDEQTLAKAEEEGVPIMTTPLTSFEIVGRLYRLGVKG